MCRRSHLLPRARAARPSSKQRGRRQWRRRRGRWGCRLLRTPRRPRGVPGRYLSLYWIWTGEAEEGRGGHRGARCVGSSRVERRDRSGLEWSACILSRALMRSPLPLCSRCSQPWRDLPAAQAGNAGEPQRGGAAGLQSQREQDGRGRGHGGRRRGGKGAPHDHRLGRQRAGRGAGSTLDPDRVPCLPSPCIIILPRAPRMRAPRPP